MESAVRYLQLQGREAEHYTEALDLMNRADSEVARSTAEPVENPESETHSGSAGELVWTPPPDAAVTPAGWRSFVASAQSAAEPVSCKNWKHARVLRAGDSHRCGCLPLSKEPT